VTTAALALAVLECFSPARRAHAGAEVSARLYAAQVELAATASRIDPYLVVALIERESGWHEGAVGAAGEVGLCQLKPHTDATKGYDAHPSVLFRAPVNIRLGVAWMAHSRAMCRTSDPLLFLSVYKGIKKRRGKCVVSAYSRAIVARAAALRAQGARLVVAGGAAGRGEDGGP